MVRTFVAVSFACGALCFAGSAGAQHMNADGPCPDATSTVEMANCFSAALEDADAELNATYKTLMSALDDEEKAALRAAQRAWITYRDRACEAEALPYRGGSARGVVQLACLEAATRERTAFMRRGLWWQVEKAEG
ncbi:lysozyme inhibitor LprI family protein [Qipengyuania sp. JC766]|uniref:lysozyme inhibitor LprI family protein n=1 Tax=Qipengyuania sp. JC766 TaxID=3232139 RepID=UPI003459CA04